MATPPEDPESAAALLDVLGAGAGGLEELQEAVETARVQWALVNIRLGEGSFSRQKVLFLHINSEACPAIQRSRDNSRTADAKRLLGSEEAVGFHPSLEIMSRADITAQHILPRIQRFLVQDAGKVSVEWMVRMYTEQIQGDSATASSSDSWQPEHVRRRRIPGHSSQKVLFRGRDALNAVAEKFGPWNWCLWRPLPGSLDVVAGGAGSIEEMREYFLDHQDTVLFGLLRLGFGVGRFHRTKHVFVHCIGAQAPALLRGQTSQQQAEMERMVHDCVHCATNLQATDSEDLTLEEVVERVRRASKIDDEEVDGDGASRSIFSVTALREALVEETRLSAEKEGSAPATKPTAWWSQVPVEELVRLIHREGPPNWALFAASEKWNHSGAPNFLRLGTGKLMPGRIGMTAPKGGFAVTTSPRGHVEKKQVESTPQAEAGKPAVQVEKTLEPPPPPQKEQDPSRRPALASTSELPPAEKKGVTLDCLSKAAPTPPAGVSGARWIAWVSVDPLSSGIDVFPKAVAEQLETAWREGQQSVELGSGWSGARVELRPSLLQVSRDGRSARDVCRVRLLSPDGPVVVPLLRRRGDRGDNELRWRAVHDQAAQGAVQSSCGVPAGAALQVVAKCPSPKVSDIVAQRQSAPRPRRIWGQ